ncbi:hypothetical protein ABZ953_08445 [Streptomyces sp. NPDC046465]
MPIDPYAALQALLRAEAARTTPPQPSPASSEQTTRGTDPTEPGQQPKDA